MMFKLWNTGILASYLGKNPIKVELSRRGDNSTYTFIKRRVMYLVSATPPKRLIGVL
jgi:hypothetical protein